MAVQPIADLPGLTSKGLSYRVVWTVTSRLLTLLVLGSAVLLVCEARSTPVRDYVFSVTGVVKTEDDAPLLDAEITLEVNGPVYQAVTPVKTATVKTDNLGRFSFMYISHKRGVKYTVAVHKQGFEPVTFSGSSPPTTNHVIHLKRAGGDG